MRADPASDANHLIRESEKACNHKPETPGVQTAYNKLGITIHVPRGCALPQQAAGRRGAEGAAPDGDAGGKDEPEPPPRCGGGRLSMKRVMWAIGLAVILMAGPTLPAAAAGGGGGYHGGGGGAYHGGGGGYHGGSGGYHGGGGYYGGGGYHGGGFHGGTRVYIGGGWGWWGWPGWWGPGYWGAPYPYYAAPPVVVQQPPTDYIQQAPAPPAAPQYWYYCQHAGAYYPYVKDCPGGWVQVAPSPNPPAP